MGNANKLLKKFLKRCQELFSVRNLASSSTSSGTRPKSYGGFDCESAVLKPVINHAMSVHKTNMASDQMVHVQVQPSLKSHLAATKIQSAFRQYMILRQNRSSLCWSDDSSKALSDTKQIAMVKARADGVTSVKAATTAPSSVDHEGYVARNPTLLQGSLQRLVKFRAMIFRFCQAFAIQHQEVNNAVNLNSPNYEGLRVGSSISNHESVKSSLMLDNRNLNLEPKSRTLKQLLQHVSDLRCCSNRGSAAHYSERKLCVYESGLMPVYLNVYDMTPINRILHWLGIGVHHSGVQVHGTEYAFGTDECGAVGIFEMKPKQCEGLKFRNEILIGWTELGLIEVKKVFDELEDQYRVFGYNLLTRNCNHFSEDACIRLTGTTIPRWVNRLARIGSVFVIPANRRRKKICDFKTKIMELENDTKMLSHSNRFMASLNSSGSSEITIIGKSSRWKRLVRPSLTLNCVS